VAEATPQVLFVCVHNAGRSQMAAAFLEQLAGDRVQVRSGGTEPADALHPEVLGAMREVGLDLSRARPRTLDASRPDVVVTMGCGDACPVFPGKEYVEWNLPDPVVMSLDDVRGLRDEIARRVERL
jgi:arsenate reductase